MFDFLERHPTLRNALGMVLIFSFFIFIPPTQTEAAPLLLLAVAVAATAAAVVIYDFNSCNLNWIWGCSNNNGNGQQGSPTGGPGGPGSPGSPTGGPGGPVSPGGTPPVACLSDDDNACGRHGTGFIVNGECNADVPSNSECPVPVIGEEGFYADPARVRAGNTTTLHWNVTNATVCALVGGGLSLPLITELTDTEETGEIEAATTYTLTCWNGDAVDSPQASEQATVTLVPSFQEI